MTRDPNRRLCEAQDLLHNVRAILLLCERTAFHLDEMASDGKPVGDLLDALGRATNVADRLALEAIIMVDQAETEIRRGVA
ncbi:MAG: hypothetical protein ACK4QP_14005 [Pseudorhizobium sp.]